MSGGRIAAIIVLCAIAVYLSILSYTLITTYTVMTEVNRTTAIVFCIGGWSIVIIGVLSLLATHKPRRQTRQTRPYTILDTLNLDARNPDQRMRAEEALSAPNTGGF